MYHPLSYTFYKKERQRERERQRRKERERKKERKKERKRCCITIYLLCWMSCLFFGFGANTVNAFWLSQKNGKVSVIKVIIWVNRTCSNGFSMATTQFTAGAWIKTWSTMFPLTLSYLWISESACEYVFGIGCSFSAYFTGFDLVEVSAGFACIALLLLSVALGLYSVSRVHLGQLEALFFAVTDISGSDCRRGFSCTGFLVHTLRFRCNRFRLYKSWVRHI